MSSFSISSNCSNKMIPFIFALLSCLTCFPTNLASHVQSYRPPKLIVFSFDAFRLDYLHPTLTPNLYRLSRLGVMANKMQSVYVTKTFPNHHSISTGMYQETHGIVSNYMYDSNTNSTFHQSNTDSRWWDNGRVNPIWV